MKLFYSLLVWIVSFQQLFCSYDNKVLGEDSSKNVWVYLCGLTEDFESSYAQESMAQIHQIGMDLGIKIIAVKPPQRSASFDNKLCWPHQNEKELFSTYEYIKKVTKNEHISGYLGFSNGGFFLLALAQELSLDVPIIAIGAGGSIDHPKAKNQINLLIGKQDSFHYEVAKQYYRQSKDTLLNVTLIEYDEGHIIPKSLLLQAMDTSQTSSTQ